jgi:hypothetical protein
MIGAMVACRTMEPQAARSTLYALPIDSILTGPGCEVCVHEFRETDFVGDMLAVILRNEGVDVMTLDLGQQES